jgi:hypothetical protein
MSPRSGKGKAVTAGAERSSNGRFDVRSLYCNGKTQIDADAGCELGH